MSQRCHIRGCGKPTVGSIDGQSLCDIHHDLAEVQALPDLFSTYAPAGCPACGGNHEACA